MNNTTLFEAKETLYDATTTIYKEIARLRRGMPIAESKQITAVGKMQVRKDYQKKIKELEKQYQAVLTAMYSV